MNAKERIFKALNHEESDKIPSFEGSIDNLSICNYYGEKYIFQGTRSLLKIAAYLIPFKNRILRKTLSSKYILKGTLEKITNLYRKAGIDLTIGAMALQPVKFFKWGYVDEFGRVYKAIKSPSGLMTKPKQLRKIFDDRGKFALELTKQCIEWGAELIWLWDDYGYKSGLFISPKSLPIL